MSEAQQVAPPRPAVVLPAGGGMGERVAKIHAAIAPDRLPGWAIYDDPSPADGTRFLMVLWLNKPEAKQMDVAIRARTIEELRDVLPEGLVCIPRGEDEAGVAESVVLVESWI